MILDITTTNICWRFYPSWVMFNLNIYQPLYPGSLEMTNSQLADDDPIENHLPRRDLEVDPFATRKSASSACRGKMRSRFPFQHPTTPRRRTCKEWTAIDRPSLFFSHILIHSGPTPDFHGQGFLNIDIVVFSQVGFYVGVQMISPARKNHLPSGNQTQTRRAGKWAIDQ